MSEQIGIDKIEKVVESLKHVALAAKKISADKKVDLADLPAAMELLVKLPLIIDSFTAWKEVIEQGKDIDVSEVIVLIQKVNGMVKEIEKA
jgi:hypothetical protein